LTRKNRFIEVKPDKIKGFTILPARLNNYSSNRVCRNVEDFSLSAVYKRRNVERIELFTNLTTKYFLTDSNTRCSSPKPIGSAIKGNISQDINGNGKINQNASKPLSKIPSPKKAKKHEKLKNVSPKPQKLEEKKKRGRPKKDKTQKEKTPELKKAAKKKEEKSSKPKASKPSTSKTDSSNYRDVRSNGEKERCSKGPFKIETCDMSISNKKAYLISYIDEKNITKATSQKRKVVEFKDRKKNTEIKGIPIIKQQFISPPEKNPKNIAQAPQYSSQFSNFNIPKTLISVRRESPKKLYLLSPLKRKVPVSYFSPERNMKEVQIKENSLNQVQTIFFDEKKTKSRKKNEFLADFSMLNNLGTGVTTRSRSRKIK
jgi:hypothetical protein